MHALHHQILHHSSNPRPGASLCPISYRVRWPFSAVSFAFTGYGAFLMFFTLGTAYRRSIPRSLADYLRPLIAKSSKWWGADVTVTGDTYRYYTVVMATK